MERVDACWRTLEDACSFERVTAPHWYSYTPLVVVHVQGEQVRHGTVLKHRHGNAHVCSGAPACSECARRARGWKFYSARRRPCPHSYSSQAQGARAHRVDVARSDS
eukprot:1267701-Pyramimonas_sp.AAC.1